MWESGAVPDVFATGNSALERPATRGRGPDAIDPSALRARLRELIGAQVLPRMFDDWAKPTQVETQKLARLLVEGRNDVFRSEIAGRLTSGTPPLVVMTGIFAPAARELGRLWENDDCDLFEVQRATGALKRWIMEIAPQAQTPAKSPSILLQVAPGETHTLGVDMATIVFRGAGWRVARGEQRGFHADLSEAWRDVVGFSLSCDRHIEALAKAIAQAREVSRNPNLLVLLGGPVFTNRSQLAETIGADFCASTADINIPYAKALLNGPEPSPRLQTRC